MMPMFQLTLMSVKSGKLGQLQFNSRALLGVIRDLLQDGFPIRPQTSKQPTTGARPATTTQCSPSIPFTGILSVMSCRWETPLMELQLVPHVSARSSSNCETTSLMLYSQLQLATRLSSTYVAPDRWCKTAPVSTHLTHYSIDSLLVFIMCTYI